MKTTTSRLLLVSAVASAYLALGGAAAIAQTETVDGSGPTRFLEETIVTAQRRETNLQETPIAITTFSEKDLRERSLTDISELNNFVPNMTITPGAGNSSSPNTPAIYIRGIGQNDFIINSDPGVGIYMDGIYIARSTGSIFDLLDVERLEVLRGPQGTLFGKNAVGGALNITTRTPSKELTGEIEAIVGDYDRTEARGYISGPITEAIAAKVSLAYKKQDGYGERKEFDTGKSIDRQGGVKDLIGRTGIRIEINDQITLDLSGDYSHNRDESLPGNVQFSDDPAQGLLGLWNTFVGAPEGIILSPAMNSPNRYDNYGTGRQYSDQDIYGFSSTLVWEIGETTFKSITGYRNIDSSLGRDGDGTAAEYIGSTYDLDQYQFSQELQLFGTSFSDKLDWLTGVYYLKEDATEKTFGFAANGLYNALEGLPFQLAPTGPPPFPCEPLLSGTIGCAGNPGNISLDIAVVYDYKQIVDSYAGFGQGTWHFTDEVSMTAGLRYTKEEKDLTARLVQRVNSGVDIIPPDSKRDTSDSEWTPLVMLEYKPSDDLMLYASAAKGFKSGGINGRVFSEDAFRNFDPESVWTYEGGFKSDLLERTLRINGAIFYNEYDDIQVTIQDTSSVSVFIGNAASGRSYGAELEVSARPAAGLDLGGFVTYIDTEYSDAQTPSIPEGGNFVKTPEWAVNLYTQYSFSVYADYELTGRVDYIWRDKYINDSTAAENIAENGYELVNARLTLSADERWALAVFATNLTDAHYVVAGLDGLGNGVGTRERIFGAPREWGVSLHYSF